MYIFNYVFNSQLRANSPPENSPLESPWNSGSFLWIPQILAGFWLEFQEFRGFWQESVGE
jgi:hypothetical protein